MLGVSSLLLLFLGSYWVCECVLVYRCASYPSTFISKGGVGSGAGWMMSCDGYMSV